jgi:hypothetical protein
MPPFRALALLAVSLLAGACDRFNVVPFAGAKIQLTIAGAHLTPAGQHLELWARDGDEDIVRVVAGSAQDTQVDPQGIAPTRQGVYIIRQAVDLADPCMIDGAGQLLWQPDAQPGCGPNPPSGCDDATQKMLQAKAVEMRVHELTDLPATPLLALVSYDDAAGQPPMVAAGASAAERLTACQTWWISSPFAYDGNPLDLTAPVHGTAFGMLDFTAVAPLPTQVLGGIQVITDFALRDLRELWLTQPQATVMALDPDQIDCAGHPTTCRGPLLLQGPAGANDRGIFRFPLASPDPTVSGTAAVYTALDQDPVMF